METMASTLSEELLLCPICLDLFNLPISTPCGHNFCKECIQGYWEIAELPQCPVCKQKLSKGPEFKVNTLLSELATQFKKSSAKKGKRDSGSVDESSSQEDFCSRHHVVDAFKMSQMKDSVSKKLPDLFSKAGDMCAGPVEASINDRLHWINEINQTAGISRENAAREIQDCLQLFQKLFHMVQKGQEDLLCAETCI